MTIAVGETTTEVTVKAYTALRVEGITIEVKGRTARITEVEVNWQFEGGTWRINFMQLTGPFLNKDGRESRQRLDETTHPDRSYGTATPQGIVDAALASVPDWTPQLSASPYPPRQPRRRASFEAGLRAGQTAATPAGITHVETTTQVLVNAYTSLRVENFTTKVKARTARIKTATVRWDYEHGAWSVGAVSIRGPVIRQSDGAESTQNVDELTRPAFASNSQYGVVTPSELVEVALANVPDWVPTINDSPYPRTTKLRSSL